jgi:hypothetical protein
MAAVIRAVPGACVAAGLIWLMLTMLTMLTMMMGVMG